MRNSVLIMSLCLSCSFLWSQNEAWYIESINQSHFKGRTEVSFYGGRADIVTDTYGIEVEFANKWKNAIGQALWYGLQLERKPGIVLVMRDIKDRKYGIMLQSAIDYAGLTDHIKVWFWPEDFGGSFSSVGQKPHEPQKKPAMAPCVKRNQSGVSRICPHYSPAGGGGQRPGVDKIAVSGQRSEVSSKLKANHLSLITNH